MNLQMIAIQSDTDTETTPMQCMQATLDAELRKFPEAVLHDQEQIAARDLDPNAYTPVLKLQVRGNRLHAGTYFDKTVTLPVAEGEGFVEHAVDVEMHDMIPEWVLIMDRMEPQTGTADRIIFTIDAEV
jgi:hypothetical protein